MLGLYLVCLGMYWGCLELYFGCLDLYFGCLDLLAWRENDSYSACDTQISLILMCGNSGNYLHPPYTPCKVQPILSQVSGDLGREMGGHDEFYQETEDLLGASRNLRRLGDSR